MNLAKLTIASAHQGLVDKEFSSTELTRAYLDQIERSDGDIKAFITTTSEAALKTAAEVDRAISAGDLISPLAGIPYAAKDIFCTEGIKTTAASKILENFISPYESTTTDRLKKENAVLVGKTNLDEFAMGSSTENSGFFTTKNPLDTTRVPGGSSGGSAAAVAAGMALYSLGTDTGGSIRQPAAFCGVVGLKPTYGRTSRYGVISMASSLDTIGHMTKTVEDAAIVLETIAGHDTHDSTTSHVALDHYSAELGKNIKGLKIGIPRQYFELAGLNSSVADTVRLAIKKIEELTGNKVVELSLPHSIYALAVYYILMPAEVSSNLARFDGVKYGLSEKGSDLLSSYLATRAKGFATETKRRIMLGTYTLSHGYYDAYYKKALQVRSLIIDDFNKAFESVDVILAPTTPTTAFKIGEKTSDPLSMYASDIFTVPANLAGLPGISIPCGKVDNLPVGLQMIGRAFDEKTILRAAYNFENN
jgi:aspartyl-tRNA(Asn)/glutamyl-tRNA(Gln) amidotransferase subunit A